MRIPNQTPPKGDWWERNIESRINITGRRTLSYRDHRVTGDREAFNTGNYYGEGNKRFQDIGNMNIQGRKVLGLLDFNLQIADNRLNDPDQRRVTVNYDRGPLKLSAGDIQGSLLNSNRFVNFSRQLSGAQVGYSLGRTDVRMLRSQTRGTVRTVSIEGNNSVGPYYLQSGRIRAESLEVRVDGEPVRLGVDYDLDSELGAITFISRVIAPTSVIVASYESSTFNTNTGTIQGAAIGYNFGRFGRLGITGIEQVGTGGGGARQNSELFQGRGAPSVPYDLDYDPIPGSVSIRIGSIPQIEGVDYVFDTTYPRRFFFTRFVDPLQTVVVNYRPRIIQSVDGDRRTWGIDYRIPLDSDGSQSFVHFHTATGERRGASPSKGTARGIDAAYAVGSLRMRGSVRDIPSTYVSVESRGFNRNERAQEWGLDYTRGRWRSSVTSTNSSVFVRDITSGSFGVARYTSATASTEFNDPDGTRWNLRHSRIANRVTNESRLDTTGLSGRRLMGRFDTTFGVERQQGRGPISDGTTTEIGDLSINSVRFGVNWDIGRGLSLTNRNTFSEITSLGKKGRGTDTSLGLTWRPNERWTITNNYINSDSGAIATLGGLSTGSGLGYDGNGFSNGVTGDFLSAGATSLRSFASTISHQANERLSINARYFNVQSQGNLASNSRSVGYGTGIDYELGKFNLLSVSLDQTETRLFDTVGTRSRATTYTAGLSGAPPGRINYALSLTGLISRGGSFGQQDSLYYDAFLGYRLRERERLLFSVASGRSAGYYGQDERTWSLGYEYQIFQNIALRATYRFRDLRNLDPSILSGNYRSSGFDLELTFDFGR